MSRQLFVPTRPNDVFPKSEQKTGFISRRFTLVSVRAIQSFTVIPMECSIMDCRTVWRFLSEKDRKEFHGVFLVLGANETIALESVRFEL